MTGDNLPARAQRGALAINDDQQAFTSAQLEAFGLLDATRGEQLVFLHTCQRTGLDPAARQIYAITRKVWNSDTGQREPRMTIQTGIDGYRLIADRTGVYAGNEVSAMGPLNEHGQPQWVEVTVRKIVGGVMVPFSARAWWTEYAQTKQNGEPVDMWRRMPINQLSKCAEALALRKAFPQDLAGVYTDDEMGQAERSHAAQPPPPRGRAVAAERASARSEPPVDEVVDGEVVDEPDRPAGPPATAAQLAKMGAQCTDLGLSREARLRAATAIVARPISTATELTKAEAHEVIEAFEQVLASDDRAAALALLTRTGDDT